MTVASTTGMEEDGPPNGREWNDSCPASVNEVSIYTVNVHVDEDILEGFNTHVQNWPTIQPDRNPPRLIRARQRLLELNTTLAEEVPGEHEDITTVDCLRMNLRDTMDSVQPPPMHMEAGGPFRAPKLERWYTVSVRSSGDGDGGPRYDTTPKVGSFSVENRGRQVLTSHKHIGEQSMDITRTYAQLYGTVMGEYTDLITNTPMFVVDYGSPWMQYHIARSLCDLHPLEAQGSVGLYNGIVCGSEPWRGRLQVDFGEAGHGEDNAGDGGSETMLLGVVTLVCNERGGPVHQFPLPLLARGGWPLVERRIQGYNEDLHATGTDESTAQKPFPRVTISYPSYLLYENNVGEAPDSSGDEWIGGEEDWVISDDCLEEDEDPECPPRPNVEDRVSDSVDANNDYSWTVEVDPDDCAYEEWSQSSDSFKATPLKDKEFERYHHQSNWTSEHITLLRERHNFTGPCPGYMSRLGLGLFPAHQFVFLICFGRRHFFKNSVPRPTCMLSNAALDEVEG